MIICRRPEDHVYSEYKTNPEERNTNKPRSKAVDIVYQAKTIDNKFKRFVFSLKDVRIEYIKEFKTQLFKTDNSWESQVKYSNQIAYKDKFSDIDILNLNHYVNVGNQIITKTIGKTKDDALEELKTMYLPNLNMDAQTSGIVIAYVLIRVGLRRIILEKLVNQE